MKLSAIIPVYNEVRTIESVVRSVLAVNVNLAKELVLVDDGSTDGPRAILKRMQAEHPEWKIILHEVNQGKGAALPHLRGPHLLLWPGLCRRQEDHMERRLSRPLAYL